MSFEIKRDITGRKFVVKLYKTRKKEYIKDFEELVATISHYFGISPQHQEYKARGLCPFCENYSELS